MAMDACGRLRQPARVERRPKDGDGSAARCAKRDGERLRAVGRIEVKALRALHGGGRLGGKWRDASVRARVCVVYNTYRVTRYTGKHDVSSASHPSGGGSRQVNDARAPRYYAWNDACSDYLRPHPGRGESQ